MENKVRWGILGAGKIAEKFASDLSKTSNSELVAVASTSLERAKSFAARHNGKHAFGNYQDMFSVKLDVVYIATLHPQHAENSILCLNNNVGVLCEKPFAMEEKDVLEVIALAEQKKLFLMEALWTRFMPTTIKALELVNSGVIGKIITLHADFGFSGEYNPENRLYNLSIGGGALLDIGIYPAFLSLLLFGYPSKILAESIFAPTGTDQTTSFIYKYNNDVTSVLNCTFASTTNCEAIIYGEKGKITIHSRFHEATQISLQLNDQIAETFNYPRDTFGYNYEIDEVNACILADKTESEVLPLDFSKKLIRLLDKTREAAGIIY
jgi:predicted dehydrogenase